MNTANLQLEGVLMAMAAICRLLREKGLVEEEDIDDILRRAEELLAADKQRSDQISSANIEAMLFPLRFLRKANHIARPDSYSTIVTAVSRARREQCGLGLPEGD